MASPGTGWQQGAIARGRLDVGNQRDRTQVAARRVKAERHSHHDGMGREVAIADGSQEVVDRGEFVQVGDLAQLLLIEVGEVDAMHAMQLLVQQVATLAHVLLATLAFEPLANALLS